MSQPILLIPPGLVGRITIGPTNGAVKAVAETVSGRQPIGVSVQAFPLLPCHKGTDLQKPPNPSQRLLASRDSMTTWRGPSGRAGVRRRAYGMGVGSVLSTGSAQTGMLPVAVTSTYP
jgi:hypothetical protein